MKTIKEIIAQDRTPEAIITDLKKKSVQVPAWSKLEKEFNPKLHPVFTDKTYVDKVTNEGLEKVSRIALGLQRLSSKRMTEMSFGIAVKRTYATTSDREKQVAAAMEKVFLKNRIDSRNIERGNMLFAGCEVVTFWFAVEQPNTSYGFKSPIKLRCKNYSPMNGDTIWPLFDEFDDMIALSFGHLRLDGDDKTEYFDTYTDTEHIQWKRENQETQWTESVREENTLGKIPAVYVFRSTPIWEDTSENIYEAEWALSRNGNYLRKNSKPILGVFADEEINYGEEKTDDFRSVFQYPKGSDLKYVTWAQATESLKFQTESIVRWFFTETQLPDMSFESMKTTPMSGEARKMMFIDAQLKVKDESGRWLEAFDREVNIVREFLKVAMPSFKTEIDSLQVECTITPYAINSEKDEVEVLTTATGGKAVVSQRQAVELLGWSTDIDKTMVELAQDAMADITQPTE